VLVPLLDKPLLQRGIEALVKAGCSRVHVFLGHSATALRNFLGEGERWGIRITCHYRNSDLSLGSNLRQLGLEPEQHYFLANSDQLPPVVDADGGGRELAICWRDGEVARWTGWGVFSGAWLLNCSASEFKVLEEGVLGDTQIQPVFADPPFAVTSHRELLRSVHRLMDQRSQPVSMGRGSVVHPSAVVVGPVYIGNFVRIGPGVHLGPHAAVLDGALVDRGAHLVDCLVLPETYVGVDIEVRQAIAAPGKLSSIANDVVLTSLEPSFLAGVSRGDGTAGRSLGLRLFLTVLQLLLLPLYGLARMLVPEEDSPAHLTVPMLGGGTRSLLLADTVAALREGKPGAWLRHFSRTFFPGLGAVKLGYISFVGPELRDVSAIRQLPDYWQAIYQDIPGGLLSESLLLPVLENDTSGHFSCDAYAISGLSRRDALRLLVRYLGRVVADVGSPLKA
jgi:hypothetical protein